VRASPFARLVALAVLAAAAPPPAPPQPDLGGLEDGVVAAVERARADVVADPDSAPSWGRLGAVLQVHGFLEQAATCYAHALELAPDEFRWTYFLARVRELDGADPDEFIALYERAATLAPEYAPVFVRLGLALSTHGRHDEAREDLLRAVELAPDLEMAQRSLGEVLLALDEPADAALALHRAAELAPKDAAVHAALGRAYRMLGEDELARGAAERAARSTELSGIPDPILEREVRALGASARQHFERAQALLALNEPAAALRELDAAAAARPGDPDVRYLQGVALERAGRTAESMQLLARAIELDPDHVRARIDLGRALEAEGRLDEAIAQYRRCREISPGDPAVLVRLSTALAEGGELAELSDTYRALADAVPDDPRVRVNLGTAYLRSGKADEAARSLEEAIAIDPDFADAYYRLGVAYELLGRPQEAVLGQFSEAVRLDPAHSAAARRLTDAGRTPPDPEDPKGVLEEFTRVAQRLYASDNRFVGRARGPASVGGSGAVTESRPTGPAAAPAKTPYDIGRFRDIAPDLGLADPKLLGGVAVEDFDGDGLLDIVTSTFDPSGPLSFRRNDGRAGFSDRSVASGVAGQLGGQGVVAGDYDNDGDADLVVLRGAWLFDDGRIRNSLLRNDGEGRFTDVTRKAGLAAPAYPSRAGAWGDYDDDGDLDLYVCNESRKYVADHADFPSQLFRNNGSGPFTEVALQAGVTNDRYCTGVTAGDYDNDGDLDLFVSNLEDDRLYRNRGDGTFEDMAPQAGVTGPAGRSSATWFFDYDNDGDLDLFVSSLEDDRLYRNRGDGTFEDVTAGAGLDLASHSMGGNFGDLDNDGWLDIYLATGDASLEPNVVLRSDRARRFEDVTRSGGFGGPRDGSAVAFADLDNDGDQEVYDRRGGLYPADSSPDALFLNPGHGNRFIAIELVGVGSNRAGYGARIRVTVETPAGPRTVHRAAGSVSSTGGSPARQAIGLGDATRIVAVEIAWPRSGKPQVLRDVALDSCIRVTEGSDVAMPVDLPRPKLGPAE
jgi:tetratricopeptide (TPR) repeat protein